MPIKTPTVLVLGAGASSDYGFPTGDKLLEEIQSDCLDDASHLRRFCSNSFAAQFVYFIKSTPGLSIDEVLEHHPQLRQIGKTAIAARLMPCEMASNLFEVSRRTGSWYQYLWDCIRTPTFDDLIHLNNMSIVTYNYDRSLDHYLRLSMKSAYRKSDDDVEQVMSQIPLIHLHGQLGSLAEFPYGIDIKTLSDEKFQKAVDGIKIIHDADLNAQAFVRAKTCLKSAMQIIFLGFGFHKTNIDRLLCPECYGTAKYATAYGFTIEKMSRLDKQLHGCDLKGKKILQFLLETCLLEN
jgi:hypothetical protein